MCSAGGLSPEKPLLTVVELLLRCQASDGAPVKEYLAAIRRTGVQFILAADSVLVCHRAGSVAEARGTEGCAPGRDCPLLRR